jgi:hypothetical protein
MHPLGIAVFFCVGLSWFVAAGWEFSKNFFYFHNLKHFLKGLDHRKPWYFYFVSSPFAYAPGFLFIPLVACVYKEDQLFRRRSLFFLVWSLLVFLLFSLAKAKRVIYLLPMAPSLAVLAGGSVAIFFEKGKVVCLRSWRWSYYLMLLTFAFVPVAALVSCYRLSAIWWILPPVSALALWFIERKTGVSKQVLIFSSLMLAIAYFVYFWRIQPDYDVKLRSARPFAQKIKEIVDGALLYRYGSYDAALEFYLDRQYLPKLDLKNLDLAKGRIFYVVTRDKYSKEIERVAKGICSVVGRYRNLEKGYVLYRCGSKEE